MEFVLTFLVLIIFVLLPLTVLILAVTGLIYGVFRAIRGEKKVDSRTASSVPEPDSKTEPKPRPAKLPY